MAISVRETFLDIFWRCQALFVIPPTRVLFGLRTRGRIPERDGDGLIVAPNHQSWIDPWMVGCALYPRRVTYLMTDTFYDLPIVGLYFRAAGTRPIRETGPSVSGIRAAQEALEAGEWVGLFPEGRITTTGELGKGQRGIARLACKTGARVLPIGVRGAIHVFSKLQKRPRLHPVEVRIGEPMRYDESPGREGEQRFTDRLMEAIRELAYGD